jgi:hypothetical protein
MDHNEGMYCISVHPSRINYYYDPLTRRRLGHKIDRDHEKTDNLAEGQSSLGHSVASKLPDQFRDNSHHGKISKTAERKINRAIDYITYLAKPKRLPYTKHGKGLLFRLNFVTLTLSSEQIHSDHEIMLRIFSPFLQSLRQKWHVTNYIWRAERQSSGGIHYHIITDKFIPWSELRDVWNKHQQRLGYVTRYRDNQIAWHSGGFRPRPELYKNWPKTKQYKAWQEGCRHDWNSPNSTDVHSLRLIINVKAYFKKYMTKEGQNSDINGRLWGCSERLSGLTGARAGVYSRINDELARIENDQSIKSVSTEYFTTIFITPADLQRLKCTELLSLFFQYINQVFPDYRSPEIFDP